MSDLGYLRPSSVFQGVNKTLINCGSGIASDLCRKPRGLHQKGKWKAAEWKYFVLSTSLVALHEWIPEDVLDGWSLLVSLVHRVCQWGLNEHLVDEIETLAVKFFKHLSDHYYKLRRERIHLCKYVYHLTLHLAENIRTCGPISLLAQWAMENFAGELKRMTHAKDLFAESAREKIKYQAASILYAAKQNLEIPSLYNADEHVPVSGNLRLTSNLEDLDGYELQHPRYSSTVFDAQEEWFPGLVRLLRRYYVNAFGISEQEAGSVVRKNRDIFIWERLHDEKTALQAPVTYRRSRKRSKNERLSCYFSSYFHGDNRTILVSYGKALGFLEHRVGDSVQILVIAAWVTSGLHKGRQNQVFAKSARDAASLFRTITVESVSCISHPIGVVEAEVPNRNGVLSQRTYFIDDMRDPHGLLTGQPWKQDVDRMVLQGLVRAHRIR